MTMTLTRRKKTERDTLLDVRYMASFMARFSVFSFLFFGVFAFLLFLLLNRRLGVSYVHDITTLNTLQGNLPLIVFAAGVMQAAITSFILFVLSLYWAHAVAGPLVRFRRYLGMVVQNKPIDETVAFRSGDQLHDLARAFDEMQKASRQRKKQFSGFCQETRDMIGGYDRLSKDPQVSASILEEKRQAIKRSYQKILALFQNKESL